LAAFDCLKPGGTMVYSTCTITPEENEAVINFLIEKREGVIIEEFDIQGIKMRKGLTQWGRFKFHSDLQKTRRIEPFDNDTEGFYIAKIKKGEI
ncbi:RsmB/NOP family class I SAM-dependent RNA methyltransferase, partial [Thermococci archaeon]